MAKQPELQTRIEGVARYLGATYPTGSINRYEDETRGIVGFRFLGAPHADVEFDSEWLATLPNNEDGVAQEMHLHHVASEINEARIGERVVFTTKGVRREAAPV